MLQKSNMLKTLELFFNKPNKKYYLTEISKEINLAHTSVKKNLKKLNSENIINKYQEKKGSRIFPIYTANKTSKKYKKLKQIYNISSILKSELIEFLDKRLTPKCIVLFGSYFRGEDMEDSDIDFFIECKKENINLKKFENKLERSIELHFNENFDSYPDELKNNIINGIVLNGFLEGYK